MTNPLGLTGGAARLFDEFLVWWIAASHPGSDLPSIPTTTEEVRAFLAEHPVTADSVLAFLAEHPGSEGTQRNRVAALNAAHRILGAPLPGAAEAVRRALNPARAARLADARAHADAVLPGLPTHGADGLLGRRDAVIVLLAVSGLSWHQIAGLAQGDVMVTDTVVTIGAQPLLELPATDTDSCPVALTRRWLTLVVHAASAAGHIVIDQLLSTDAGATPPDAVLRARYADQPLLPVFDERGMAIGYIDELVALAPEDVATIAAQRLTRPGLAATATALDPGWHARGVAARWRNKPRLDELDELLDRFDELIAPYIQEKARP
ncbi:hypothetical protein [Nocardia neocaledoniensis]|uniref:hypothetical protein n=1 Tax=Nocardia neocaledoniensis TaxID=236511 RepID=UPI002456FB83|nr:hypothetical protein [Nocardia neocaledoniensis]